MRRSIIQHIAIAVVLIFVMEVLPVASNDAHKRCQKSGCLEGAAAAAEEPTLVVGSARTRKSPSTKFFPFFMLWVASFFVLRLAIQFIHRFINLISVFYSKLPAIRVGALVGHFSMMYSRRSRQKNKSGQGMRSRTSSASLGSLGSLADLLDDSSADSSSAGYSSGYSITSSDGESNDESSALESQSGSGFSGLTFSDSEADSTTDDQSRRKDSIVSKFLTYISESNPDGFVPRRSLPPQRKNAPGPVDNKLRRSHNNMATVGLYNQSSNNRDQGRERRYSVDETNYPSYRTKPFASSEGSNRRASTESNNQRRGRSNVPEPSSITRGKSSNEGAKMRKAAAAAKTKMTSENKNNGKSKSPKRQQQQKQQRPTQQQHHEQDEKKKKSSRPRSS